MPVRFASSTRRRPRPRRSPHPHPHPTLPPHANRLPHPFPPHARFHTASLLIRQPSPTQVPCRPACTVLDQPHPIIACILPAGLHAGDRLFPRDNPLPTLLPRFPPRARHPKRGLRSRVVQTVVLAMCLCGLIPPTQWQGQKSMAMRRDSPLRLWSPLWTVNVALYYVPFKFK